MYNIKSLLFKQVLVANPAWKPLFVQMLLIFALLMLTGMASAKEAQPLAANPELEKQAMAISEELRCLVCQNQTIAASEAGLAKDLKNQVRTMLAEGKSKKEILDFMVKRYGDFVLYRPPVKPTTYALWGGPAILMLLGVSILLFNLKNRKKVVTETPLSEEQNKQLTDLLSKEEASAPATAESKKEGDS